MSNEFNKEDLSEKTRGVGESNLEKYLINDRIVPNSSLANVLKQSIEGAKFSRIHRSCYI